MNKQTISLSTCFAISCVWFTTQFGGGFASGRQIIDYFVSYGWYAVFTPILAQAVMAILFYFVLKESFAHKLKNYSAFTAHLYDTQQCYAVYRTPITLEQLPSLPLVLHNRNESTQHSIFQWWKEHFTEQPNIGIHVTDLDTSLDMVANGLGYSIAFGSFLEKRPDFFLLPLYHLDRTPFIRKTWFLYSEGSLANPYIKCFVNFVLQRLDRAILP